MINMSVIRYGMRNEVGVRRIKGVIFDMDGTLTIPCIDFVKMRRVCQVPEGEDILSFAHRLGGREKKICFERIEMVELEGRNSMKLQPGVWNLLNFLKENGMKRSIVTRNSKEAVDHMTRILVDSHQDESLRINMKPEGVFDKVLTRDFLPFKPDPAAALHICKDWGMDPHDILFVGDWRDDLLCGGAAGNVTCLLNNDKNVDFKDLAHLNVDSLHDLIKIISDGFSIESYDRHLNSK
eukprot:TRINITY_DN4711_c0_g1_i1.p1 TRINITY_DN4711_c0_g1~~TRINITY_DN4711_c0_g1_i1.p1  ORF type:complete len:238 (-),score=77.40 TRINITY_DN4711_c0_g1_i1:79-792(-)